MAIARSTREVVDYIPEDDRGLEESQQTTFQLRRLPHRTMLRIIELETAGHVSLVNELAVRAGVAGIVNLQKPDGGVVTCKHDSRKQIIGGIQVESPLALSVWEVLPIELMVELSKAVVESNQATEDDVKN